MLGLLLVAGLVTYFTRRLLTSLRHPRPCKKRGFVEIKHHLPRLVMIQRHYVQIASVMRKFPVSWHFFQNKRDSKCYWVHNLYSKKKHEIVVIFYLIWWTKMLECKLHLRNKMGICLKGLSAMRTIDMHWLCWQKKPAS